VVRATVEPFPQGLAASIAASLPRVVVVCAPAGYRKAALLRAYALHAGALVRCDLGTDCDDDLARPVLDAVVSRDRYRSARSAADRLARRSQTPATSREALRREWEVAERPELFVLRDPAAALATPAGADLVAELIGALPPVRTLAIATRVPLPSALRALVPWNRAVEIGPADLALSAEAVHEAAVCAGVAPAAARTIHELTQGWPLVTRLLVDLLRYDCADDVVEAAATLAPDRLLAFAAHRTIAHLGELVREGLVVAALRHGGTHADLVRALGDAFDDLSFARLSALPFVTADGESAVVHPDVAQLLRRRFSPLVKTMYERVLDVLTGDGAYVDAARIALEGGDTTRAAAIIDAAPPYTAAPVPLDDYVRVIERIDRSLITRFPNLWIATIPYRTFAVDRATFVREAETVYYCLSSAATADQRALALMLLANAYINLGRIDEYDALVDEALGGFAAANGRARASLLNFAAAVLGIQGRFAKARALANEAAAMSRDDFGENQTLHYIDAHEAGYRGRYDRATVIFDELLRRRGREALPLYLAHGATNAAFFAWMSGDDARFERYLGAVEEALTPGLERGFMPMIDAARGRPLEIDDRYPWPIVAVIAHLYRLGRAAQEPDALAAARAAARIADASRDPYSRILAHVALHVLDAPARDASAAVLRAVAPDVESPELQAAVAGILGGGSPGVLATFVRRRVRRERERAAPRLVVELLAGRVTRDGEPVRLSEKEFELCAFLAASTSSSSRERIGEALWDHLDPEEWPNNLKVTLSRVRAKLRAPDAVLSAEGRYRLSPVIEVDLRRAETVVRELRGKPLDEATGTELRAVVAALGGGAHDKYARFAWAQSLLARILDVASTAGLALADDALRAGRFDEALAFAADVAALDPFNEGACECTVRVLLARSELDAARREFRRYAGALAAELGAAPSKRLAELVRAVR
jgi:DNA-binding SARP family transcriptional activator